MWQGGQKHIFSLKNLLCTVVQAGDLGQLCLIFTHQILDVVLGSMFDVSQLLANTRQNDVFW